MQLQDVVDIVGGLDDARVPVWVDGGWCVDALVEERLRDHSDLDLAVDRADEEGLRAWLESAGFVARSDVSETAWNFVLVDHSGRSVDVHVFAFDVDGRHVYGVEYPAESLTGSATLGGLPIRCIAPEWMFRFKTAYNPAAKDLIDVRALAAKFGFAIPPSHHSSATSSFAT